MKQFNNLGRMLRAATVLTAMITMTFAGCKKVDDTLGSNLIPGDQQMKAGYTTMGAQFLNGELNPLKYVETRLFQTDSLISSNLTYGYMGSMLSDTFGLRTAGFLSQYISYYKVDSGYFGFRPILDSVQLLLSISSYGSDTLTPQRYNVYEVIDNKYLTEKPIAPGKTKRDTTFYINFDPEAQGVVGNDVLFTFTFPDGTKTGPTTSNVTMSSTDKGREFIARLMLQSGEYKDDYSIYATDSLEHWVNEFKGIYILPAEPQTTVGKGNIYSADLSASGFSVYGRNRVKDDPTLIKDTIALFFYFYDSYSTEYGNVSVNTIRRDYSLATSAEKFDIADAVETNENRPLSKQVYVDGMGGVATEVTFTKEFFEELWDQIEKENEVSKKNFTTLAVSQAKMSVYFEGSNYDWTMIDPGSSVKMIDQMNAAQTRLGMYTNFKTLEAISDYAYLYEKNYSTTLAYGGYINHSRGCYTMDITGHIQTMWNSYQKQVKAAGGKEKVDWDKVEGRKVYLGPEAYGLYTTTSSVLQGMTPDALTKEDAPIKIDLAYNLIK